MLYLLAVVLPPLAVLFCGKPFQALLSIPLTLLATRPLKSMLYGISPLDPVAFGLSISVLILVSACAALAPARRAASVEPMQALRME